MSPEPKPDMPYQQASLRAMGRGIAEFRQGLLDGGCPREVAERLTSEYLGAIAFHAMQPKPNADER